MIKKMYKNDNIPDDFAKSKIALIRKKGNSTECMNFRTKSFLTSNILHAKFFNHSY